MKINPNLIVLEEVDDSLILKLGSEEVLLKISKIEMEIITYFSFFSVKKDVIENFKNVIEIDSKTLDLLIDKAIQNKILTENEIIRKNKTRISFLFRKNKKIFEILNLDFTNSSLESFFENKKISSVLIILTSIIFGGVIINLLSEPLNFKENYLKTIYKVPVSFSDLIFYIYLASFTSTLIHEFGHYFVYKVKNGKTSVFGFGLLFFFMPVAYNRVSSTLIKKRRDRILINSAGILFDLLQFVLLLYFTKLFHEDYPTISFFGYILMISIIIRTFFNLNIFLPSSDGYFVFAEIIKKDNLYEIATTKTKNIFSGKEDISYKNFLCAIYLLFCICSFTISWAMLFLPLLMYFYYVSVQ